MDFKWRKAMALGCCCALVAGRPAKAEDSNPYSVIAERNVFHLNPPPPPPAPEEAPKADLPVIKITGIVKIGGKIRALFVTQPKNAKDAPTYFNLAEGERDGILEVVKIDVDDQKVDVVNSGKLATLTVKDDSLAISEGTAPAGAGPAAPGANAPPPFPGMPGGMAGARRVPPPAFPGMVGNQNPAGANPGTPYAFPMRTRRTTPGAQAQ